MTTSPPETEICTWEIVTVPEQLAEADAVADELEELVELLELLELLEVLDAGVEVWPLSAQATAIPTVESAAAVAPTATAVAALRVRII